MKHEKKITRLIVCAALLAAAVFSGSARAAAQEKGGATITLAQSIEAAMAGNPELKAAEEKLRGAEFGARLAAAQGKPLISYSETISRSDSPVMGFMSVLSQERFTPAMMGSINDPGGISNFNSKLTFQIPLFTGGKVESGKKIALGVRGANGRELERKRQEIRLRVVEAYLSALLAQESMKVVDEAYRTAQAHVKMATDHLGAGTVVKSDLLSAEVRLAQVEEMRLEQESGLRLARAALFLAMGAPQDTGAALDPSPLAYTDSQYDLKELIGKAMTGRAELKMLDEYGLIGRESANMARASRRPSLSMMAEYDMDGENAFDKQGESWFAGAVVTMSIFDGGRAKQAERQALSGALEAERKKEALAQGIEFQARQAYLELETARKRIGVTARAVEQSEEALRIVENRYENGLTTIVEVLESEMRMTEANLRNATARKDYALGLEKLMFAIGAN